jgi:DNA-binding response OmpR family regulator
MKVLVVEDDASIRETLGMVLEACGFSADLVEDGELALEYLGRNWPDVMLLDLTLPGITGEEVFREIGKRFNRVPPTVVISAAQEGLARAAALQGAYYLAKPYTIEQLDELIRAAARPSAA